AWSLAPGVVVLVLATWAVKVGAARGGNGRQAARGGNGRQAAAQAAVPMPPVAACYHPLPPALYAISAFYLLRMPETLLILRSQQLGVSTAAVLLLWAALHVVRSSASFAGGRLTDRIGASRTMWLGWLAYAGVAAGFATARGAGAAWTLFLAFGIVAGLTESPERTLVAQFAGGHQGSGF